MIHGKVRGQLKTEIHRETEVEETLLEEPVEIRDFQVKKGVLPEEIVIREEEEVMMIQTPVMMGMEMILPPQTPLSQGKENKSPKYVYVLQGPPGPKGQEGRPGQAGRDGRDGQNLSLTRELEETLKAHRPNLDTTGLENSFDQFGRTIFEVLNAQHRTNQKLEEQFRRANETQEYQAEAMQDMAQANFQMKYDHMFAGVPMYDGTDPDTFDDWLYQIESLCELSSRDVRVELMGRASAQVK